MVEHTSFFFNDTATTEIYALSLHDALPICTQHDEGKAWVPCPEEIEKADDLGRVDHARSEEQTSELQSLTNLVCRLLLDKKNKLYIFNYPR